MNFFRLKLTLIHGLLIKRALCAKNKNDLTPTEIEGAMKRRAIRLEIRSLIKKDQPL